MGFFSKLSSSKLSSSHNLNTKASQPAANGTVSSGIQRHQTPAERVPSELLEHIFDQLLENDTPTPPLEYQNTVFRLQLVCKMWHAVISRRKSLVAVSGKMPSYRLLGRWKKTNGALGVAVRNLHLVHLERKEGDGNKMFSKIVSLCPSLEELNFQLWTPVDLDLRIILEKIAYPLKLKKLNMAGNLNLSKPQLPLQLSFPNLESFSIMLVQSTRFEIYMLAQMLKSMEGGQGNIDLDVGKLDFIDPASLDMLMGNLRTLAPRLRSFRANLHYSNSILFLRSPSDGMSSLIKSMRCLRKLDINAWNSRRIASTGAVFAVALDWEPLTLRAPILRELRLVAEGAGTIDMVKLLEYLKFAKLASLDLKAVTGSAGVWDGRSIQPVREGCEEVGTRFTFEQKVV
ncbi:hypothetical protein T439DRAFT_330206 [Meredithblackwellia eburnea MCA 4105]